jgi:hypothetical protein
MAKKDKRRKSTVEKQARNRRKSELYKSRSEGPAFYSQSETPEQREERLARLGVDITRVDVQEAPRKPVKAEKRVAQMPQTSTSKLTLAEQIEKAHHALSYARAQIIPLPKGVVDRILPVRKVGILEKDDPTDVARNDMVIKHREQCAYVSRLANELESLNQQYEQEHKDKRRLSAKEFERREQGIKKQHGGSARDDSNLVNPYGRRSRDTSWW